MPVDELSSTKYQQVKDYPDYRVGDDGSVWSCQKNTKRTETAGDWHRLIGGIDKDGYARVILCRGGKHRRYLRVNILILRTFNGSPPCGMKWPTAAHNNGIKRDNRLSNLQWKTQKDNIADKHLHGTAQIGEKNPRAKLTEKEISAMQAMKRRGHKWREVAESFGRKLCTVYAACKGENWKHLRKVKT